MESARAVSVPPEPDGLSRQPSSCDRATPAFDTEIRIGKRFWQAREVDVRSRLPMCIVCLYSLAQSSLCSDVTHAVCAECRPRILVAGKGCPECRQPCEEKIIRDVQDRSLRQTQRALLEAVTVRCMVCHHWSGPVSEVDWHRALCGETLVRCCWHGCEWTGLQDKQQAHAAGCDWKPVRCSFPGCGAETVRCQKEEHEAVCDWRPARLGALVTDARTVHQIESLSGWCQGGIELCQTLSDMQLREEVLPAMMRCLPLLHEAVRNAVPAGSPDSEAACPWVCGFRTTVSQMPAHYEHCPGVLVSCDYCPERIPRFQLREHLLRCEDRPVSCPRGCGAEGLRARDIAATGLHSRECRILVCGHCKHSLRMADDDPAEVVLALHKAQCPCRPVQCPWCFGAHPKDRLQEESALCHARRLAEAPCFRGQPLVLHSGATGPVYVTRTGVDNPVFIRLPGEMLAQCVSCDVSMKALTPSVCFVWNGMSCSLGCDYQLGEFRLQFFNSSPCGQKLSFAACLRRSDGSLIEELGTVVRGKKSARGGEASGGAEPRLVFAAGYVGARWQQGLNAFAGRDSGSPAVLIHLDIRSCRD